MGIGQTQLVATPCFDRCNHQYLIHFRCPISCRHGTFVPAGVFFPLKWYKSLLWANSRGQLCGGCAHFLCSFLGFYLERKEITRSSREKIQSFETHNPRKIENSDKKARKTVWVVVFDPNIPAGWVQNSNAFIALTSFLIRRWILLLHFLLNDYTWCSIVRSSSNFVFMKTLIVPNMSLEKYQVTNYFPVILFSSLIEHTKWNHHAISFLSLH